MPAPYNYNTVPINPVGAFEAGVQARQTQLANQQGLQQNAMKLAAEQSATQAQQAWDAAVAKGDLQTANRIDPTHTQRYLGNLSQLNSEQRKQVAFAATQRFHMAAMAANSPNPVESMNRMIQANPRLFPLAQNGVQTPADVQHVLAEAKYGAMTTSEYDAATPHFQTLTADQAAQKIPGGLIPGQAMVVNTQTGEPSIIGTPAVKVGNGLEGPAVIDLRKGIAQSGPVDINKPLPGYAEKLAQMLAHYDAQPSAYLLRSREGQLLMARAKAINPDYSSTVYSQIQQARKDFATGKQGQAVKALNATVNHLDTMDQLANALSNGDVRQLSRVKQFFKQEFGSPAPTNFDAAKAIVSGEIAKAIVGGQATELDREHLNDALSRAHSWDQLKGVIQTFRQLMAGQLEAFRQQYKASTYGSDKDFNKFLSAPARRELENLSTQPENAQPQAQQQNAPTNAPAGVPHFRIENGQLVQVNG